MASYDNSKHYKWDRNDTFEISGGEFGTMLNALRAMLSTEEAARILMVERAADTAEAILARYVEEGIIKEAPSEEKNNVIKLQRDEK